MRSVQKWGLAAVIAAMASPVSAQIISTSIPKGLEGKTAKTAAFHVMVSPFAKWKYGEVYLDPNDVFGTIEGKPNSDFMVAAEGAFGNPASLNFAVGGWYNKIGTNPFDFFGYDSALQLGSINATIDTDLTVIEGHGGVYYKNFGVQIGIVKTSGDFKGGIVTKVNGNTVPATAFTLDVPKADTTDWDAFLVYKQGFGEGSKTPVNLAIGAGLYRKAGEETAPIRGVDAQTVPSLFVSAGVGLFKGFGIDASFWYIGETDATKGANNTEFASDTQTRMMVGIGYSF